MTATIVNFPCAIERLDIELARTGANELTRAFDEANRLFPAAAGLCATPYDFAQRLDCFGASIDRLEITRPDEIQDYVILDDTDWLISLRAMPAMLRALARLDNPSWNAKQSDLFLGG